MAENPTSTPAQMAEAIISKEFIATGIGPITALAESHRDLLAALMDVSEYYGPGEFMPQVRAAIAKATGGAA